MERETIVIDNDVVIISSRERKSVEVWEINKGAISHDHVNLGVCNAFDIQSDFATGWNRNYYIDVEVEAQMMIAEGCPNSD